MQVDVLRHRDLGDDGGADRARRRRCARPACCSARILAVVFLKEPLLMPRVVAALMIVCGLVLIRLA